MIYKQEEVETEPQLPAISQPLHCLHKAIPALPPPASTLCPFLLNPQHLSYTEQGSTTIPNDLVPCVSWLSGREALETGFTYLLCLSLATLGPSLF